MADAPAWASLTWRDPDNASALLTLKARVAAILAIKEYADGSGESAVLIADRWFRVDTDHATVLAAVSGDDILWVGGTYRDPEQQSAEVAIHIRSLAIDASAEQPGNTESVVIVAGQSFRLRVTTPAATLVNTVKTSEPGPGGGDGGIGGGGSTEISI